MFRRSCRLLGATLLLFANGSAHACKCIDGGGLGAKSDEATIVVFGRVSGLTDIAGENRAELIRMVENDEEPQLGVHYGVRVRLSSSVVVLKGSSSVLESITVPYESSSCGPSLSVGTSYILFVGDGGVVLPCGGAFEFEVMNCEHVSWFKVFSRRLAGESVSFTMPHEADELDSSVLEAMRSGKHSLEAKCVAL